MSLDHAPSLKFTANAGQPGRGHSRAADAPLVDTFLELVLPDSDSPWASADDVSRQLELAARVLLRWRATACGCGEAGPALGAYLPGHGRNPCWPRNRIEPHGQVDVAGCHMPAV
jgi:hypothetical protein